MIISLKYILTIFWIISIFFSRNRNLESDGYLNVKSLPSGHSLDSKSWYKTGYIGPPSAQVTQRPIHWFISSSCWIAQKVLNHTHLWVIIYKGVRVTVTLKVRLGNALWNLDISPCLPTHAFCAHCGLRSADLMFKIWNPLLCLLLDVAPYNGRSVLVTYSICWCYAT